MAMRSLCRTSLFARTKLHAHYREIRIHVFDDEEREGLAKDNPDAPGCED